GEGRTGPSGADLCRPPGGGGAAVAARLAARLAAAARAAVRGAARVGPGPRLDGAALLGASPQSQPGAWHVAGHEGPGFTVFEAEDLQPLVRARLPEPPQVLARGDVEPHRPGGAPHHGLARLRRLGRAAGLPIRPRVARPRAARRRLRPLSRRLVSARR